MGHFGVWQPLPQLQVPAASRNFILPTPSGPETGRSPLLLALLGSFTSLADPFSSAHTVSAIPSFRSSVSPAGSCLTRH